MTKNHPNTFKEFENKGWNSCFQKYNEEWTRLSVQTFEVILNQLKKLRDKSIDKNNRVIKVLDIACGSGELSAELSRNSFEVTGIDFASEMIQVAKNNFPNISFEIGDAEKLEFSDHTFDAVVMNFGILHLENPEEAIKEARRVLKDDGKYLFSAWTNPQESAGFGIVLDSIKKFGNINVELPKGPPFFRFGEIEETKSLLEKLGFQEVVPHKVPMKWIFNTPEDFFDAFYYGTARTGAILRGQEEEQLKLVKEEICRVIKDFHLNSEDGNSFVVPMCSFVWSADLQLGC